MQVLISSNPHRKKEKLYLASLWVGVIQGYGTTKGASIAALSKSIKEATKEMLEAIKQKKEDIKIEMQSILEDGE